MSELPLASAVFLASSAFQAMTPRTLAVMTSAKAMITAVDVIRRSGPPGSGGFRWGIICLVMTVPDLVAGNAREESKRRPVLRG